MGRGLSNSAIGDLYRRYGHLMLRRCRVVLRDKPLAESALQEVFIKLMRYGAQIRQVDDRLRWIYRVTDRCCFDALGRRQGQGADHAPAQAAGIPHPSVRPKVRDAVMSLLHELQDAERTLAVWRFVDGEGEAEIAAEVDWSLRAVNVRLLDIQQRVEQQPGAGGGDAGPPETDEHPSPIRLEAWSVGEPDPGVDQHVGDCKECRDYVVSLEMEKEVFLDREDPELFVPRVRRVADTELLPVVGLVQPKPEPTPEPEPEPEPEPALDAAPSGDPEPAGDAPPAEGGGASWLFHKRWWLAGPALAAVAVAVAVVAVRMHVPHTAPGAGSTGANAGTGDPDPDPEEVIRLKGPIKIGAVVMGIDGKQSRVSGMAYTTAGIKVRVELTVPGAMPITVGVVDDSGEWIPLVKNRRYAAGVHLLENDLAFDGRPTTVRVIAGTSKQVTAALKKNTFKDLPTLLIQPVGKK